jgi:hypothetical protein
MTDRFVVQEYLTSCVRIYDKVLDCQWVVSINLWFALNDTTVEDVEKCKVITQVLYDEAINCIIANHK